MMALRMVRSCTGLSSFPVCTEPMRSTTRMPSDTRPKMVCLPSSQGVGASVMKLCGLLAPTYTHTHTHTQREYNWLPLVLGPLLAMLSTPAPVCLSPGWISSANLPP